MKLCVGAASRRVVEEAARLQVHQIVASRRQVNADGGYIGLTSKALVELVRDLSDGETQVVRDHGGPKQGGFDDDGVEAFDDDVVAGFDALHIDVCELTYSEQEEHLVRLCQRYNGEVGIEIGGEHEHAMWNTQLLIAVLIAGIIPNYVVIGAGTHVWADRQIGHLRDGKEVRSAITYAHKMDIKTKVHNADWIGNRLRWSGTFDAYNLAPELGQVEVRAILTMLSADAAQQLLRYAYETSRWTRWFDPDQGTYVERAECAIRYVLNEPHVVEFLDRVWSPSAETYVRECVRDAIVHG